MDLRFAAVSLGIGLFVASAACTSRVNFNDDDDGDCPSSKPEIACVDCNGLSSALVCVDGNWTCPPQPPDCGDCGPMPDWDCEDGCGNFHTPSCVDGSWECVDEDFCPEPGPRWATSFEGSGFEGGDAIAIDAQGDVIVAGHFTGTIAFGQGYYTSAGGTDVFVVKLDSSGNLKWARTIAGSQDASVVGLAVRPNGAVVVAASFLGLIDVSTWGFIAPPGGALVLAEYGPAGTVSWARDYDVYPDPISRGLALDGDNIVVAGSFWTATANLGGMDLVSNGGQEIFVAKLDADGDHLWSRSLGDASAQEARAVVMADGAVYLTGSYAGSIAIESGTLTASAGREAFLIKLDTDDGVAQGGTSMGGTGNVRAGSVVPGDDGVVVLGAYEGEWDSGSHVLPAGNGTMGFWARVSDLGVVEDAESFTGPSKTIDDLELWSMATSSDGKLILAGQFDSQTGLADPGDSAGSYDIALASFDLSDNKEWGYSYGGFDDEWIGDVAVGLNGDIAITGTHFGELDLSTITLHADDGNAFVAVFDAYPY